MIALEDEKNLDKKIEIMMDLLCTKIKGNIGSKEIQEIYESLDKLIVNYLRN